MVKKLWRDSEDYVGTPIDRLARIMGVKSDDCNLRVDGKILDNGVLSILSEYAPAVSVGEKMFMPATATKGMLEDVAYAEVRFHRSKLSAQFE